VDACWIYAQRWGMNLEVWVLNFEYSTGKSYLKHKVGFSGGIWFYLTFRPLSIVVWHSSFWGILVGLTVPSKSDTFIFHYFCSCRFVPSILPF
jgi:hypothetical protein